MVQVAIFMIHHWISTIHWWPIIVALGEMAVVVDDSRFVQDEMIWPVYVDNLLDKFGMQDAKSVSTWGGWLLVIFVDEY